MSFTLIKGTFHAVGYSPDGDSIRFKADNSENWSKLMGISPPLNEFNHVQIRLIGIDSLETHFHHCQQSVKWALSAANFLLKYLEIELNTPTSDRYSLAKYRAATIHHRLASLLHNTFRTDVS